jgi:hypothetical protein
MVLVKAVTVVSGAAEDSADSLPAAQRGAIEPIKTHSNLLVSAKRQHL